MKKRSLMLAATAIAAAIMLTACSSGEDKKSDTGNTSAGTQKPAQSEQVQKDTTGEKADTDQLPSQGEISGTPVGEDSTVAQTDAQSTGGTSEQTPQSGAQSEMEPQSETQAESENIPLIDPGEGPEASGGTADTGAEASGDLWSGTYSSETETLTITYLDEESVSFSFKQSGISGTAALSGTQAVYKGDDYHDVVFGLSGDTITVAVSSEEDYDSSESPLIGTYTKE